MNESWKTILALSSFALTSTAEDVLFDTRLMVQQAGLPSVLSNGPGPPPQLDIPNTRPARSIHLSQIVPIQDASGNSRCCPIGTVNNVSGCVFPHSSVCPEGTRLEGNTCISEMPPKYPDAEPRCNPGFTYQDGNCVSLSEAGCPPGFTLKNRLCTSSSKPQCPASFKYEDGSCVDSKPQFCSPGSKLADGNCVGEAPPSCPPGYVINKGVCTHEPKPRCPPGSSFDGTACVSEKPPSCEPGFFNGKVCEDKPSCPPGFNLEGRVCVSESRASCPGGTYIVSDKTSGKSACCYKNFDFNRDTCFKSGRCWISPTEEPSCPTGGKWNGKTCIVQPVPQCRAGQYTNGRCIITESPRCRPGAVFNGENCVLEDRAACPPGSVLSGKKYGSSTPPVCEPGHTLTGN
ncbi:hypothetical protein J7337_012660 [Fusarium musae]|uniref:Tenascin X n=1 Tax=Fusarium musae TaxID=1042133 RepID=A0A9P8IJH7_9HYPO|nr:hypothetical protein J7337_012660 [Fusarium musae]KAG9496084.1 hypothetical protein J7337_012660 [Fusarium musae]